jgi:hypothetical protein
MSGHEDETVSVAIKAQNPDLETAWRTIAWWEHTCAYWHGQAQEGYALRDSLAARDARVAATARADALREAADALPGFDSIRTHGDAADWLRTRASNIVRAATEDPS